MTKAKYKGIYQYCGLSDCKYFEKKCRLAATNERRARDGELEIRNNRSCYAKKESEGK